MNTLLGAAAGSITTSAFSAWKFNGQTKIDYICNGMLGGLVAVTANCDGVETWAAFVIGSFTPIFLVLGESINEYFHVDDVIGAVPVHGTCGVWGVIATGFFHTEYGLLYTGKFRFLGVQCLGLVATCAWAGATTFVWVWCLNKFWRPIRITRELEESGADGPEHGIVNAMTIPKLFKKSDVDDILKALDDEENALDDKSDEDDVEIMKRDIQMRRASLVNPKVAVAPMCL